MAAAYQARFEISASCQRHYSKLPSPGTIAKHLVNP